jgi:hypothetical protein
MMVKSLAPEVFFRYGGGGELRAGTTLTVETASLPKNGYSVAVFAMRGNRRSPAIRPLHRILYRQYP